MIFIYAIIEHTDPLCFSVPAHDLPLSINGASLSTRLCLGQAFLLLRGCC